jgi:hypothetical protein
MVLSEAARRTVVDLSREVHIPYTVGQDKDGVWCAHAYVGCNGNGKIIADFGDESYVLG